MSIEHMVLPQPDPSAPAKTGSPAFGGGADASQVIPGRARELTTITDIASGRRRDCAVVLVEGDPGMGVSSLLSAARTAAAGCSRLVISGVAAPGRHSRGASPALFYDALGPSPLLGVLRQFEPWLREATRVSAGGDLTSTTRWHELCAALRADLGSLAHAHGGVLVTLDDVQWADPTSVDLLVALLRHRPPGRVVLMIGCHAGKAPCAVRRALGNAPGDALHVRLGPLDADDLRCLEPTSTTRRRRALLAASAGNPRHLRALATLPTSALETLAVAAAGSAEVTDLPCAADAATAELLALPHRTHVTAGVAALLGDHIEPDAVSAVTGVRAEDVEADLDDLVDRDLLHHHDSGLRFRHPLVRAAAYRLMRPVWRAAVHWRIDRWLAARDATLVARAPHLAGSARFGNVATAELLTTAAREVLPDAAAAAAAWLSAARRTRRGPLPAADEVLHVRAALLAGRPDDAARIAAAALAGTRAERLPIALTLARLQAARGDFTAAAALLRAELTTATGADRALLGIELDAIDASRGSTSPALRTANGHNGPGTEPDGALGPVLDAARTIVNATRAVAITAGPRELALLDAAARTVDALADDGLAHLLPRLPALIATEHRAGRHADAVRHAERALAVATRSGAREHLSELRVRLAAIMLDLSHLPAAAQLAEDALDDARDLGFDDLATAAAALRAQIAAWTSGPDDAARWRHTVGDAVPADRWARIATTIAHLEIGMATNEPADDTTPTSASADVDIDPRLGVAAARAALTRGASDEADALLVRAQNAVARPGTDLDQDAGNAMVRADVQATRARLAIARHDATRAVTLARAAVTTLAAVGSAIPTARAMLVLAEALAATGDNDAAIRESRAAIDLIRSTGATWLAQLTALQARRARSVAPSPCDGLSPREREIADLVGAGLTNKMIAERLFLSVRTVDSHVARILNKLGVSSRVGVANLVRGAS